jgi:hypothetical protein
MEDPAFQPAIAEVSAALKLNLTFQSVSRYYDRYICMFYEGRNVNPVWTTPGPTKNALDTIWAISPYLNSFFTEQQLSATATGYFNETYNHFKRVVADQSGVQWAFYSAHDTTVGNFLARLNLTSPKCIY